MRGKRLLQTLRLCTMLSSTKRTNYLKEQHIFGKIGENCNIMSRKIPLYAKLIKLGNNVRLASDVTFVTHDITHAMLNAHPDLKGQVFHEKVGCIEIQDNVFVGTGTIILYGVRIGENVIIGAGSLVNKDIPPNCVVGGVPAKFISSFEDYLKKRKLEKSYPQRDTELGNEQISDEMAAWCWDEFNKSHAMKAI